MEFDTEKFNEGVFPRRRPWLLLLVAVIVAYPVYRLGVYVCNRVRPQPAVVAPANPSISQPVAVVVPVRRTDASSGPVVGRPAAVVRPTTTAVSPVSVSNASGQAVAGHAGASPVLAPEQVRAILARGQVLEDRGEMEEAAKSYSEALAGCREGPQRSAIEDRLGRVNVALLLSRKEMAWKVRHVVKPGDAVEKIARREKTTTELIAALNGLGARHSIQIGQALLVFNGHFSINIRKSAHELTLKRDGEFFRSYKVCIGADNKTQAGSFVITSREINPTWFPQGQQAIPAGDQRNLLGTRWMAIKDPVKPAEDRRGLGIHGTRDEGSIGKSLSAGCIRMRNSDVEELHMFVPVGTPVTITE